MIDYKTNLSIKECEEKFNLAIAGFPKKQKERNKIDCFRGRAKNGKLSIIYSRPLNYPYHRRQGNIALVGKMFSENSVTRLTAKFVSPVLIKSFYIPYFAVVFSIFALYSIFGHIAVLALYKEFSFFVIAYILLIFLSKSRAQSYKDKIMKFIEDTMELTKIDG